jgi:nicotinamide riboside transporter PnuC
MGDVLKQLIPLLLSANTLTLTWLVGNRRTSGWVLGCIGQALWFVFIFTWQVWGLLPLAVCLTFVYARNLIRWRREQRAETAEFVAELVPCDACADRGQANG